MQNCPFHAADLASPGHKEASCSQLLFKELLKAKSPRAQF